MIPSFALLDGGSPATAQPITDPFFANVQLLLHMDGTNGSTTFTDSSTAARTVTAVGNAQISTARQKYGTASGLFDGAADYLSVPDAAGFDFSTGDFTVEFWIYPTAADFGTVLEHANSPASGAAGLFIEMHADRSVYAGQAFGSSVANTGSSLLTLNQWTHVAVQRSGTTWTIFLDGTACGTGTSAVNLDATGPVTLGGNARTSGDSMTGNLDDFRVTKGVARFSGNFTPPTAAHPNS